MATNQPGQSIEVQRCRAPVMRPSMAPDLDHTTRPSATLPSASRGKSSGHRPGLSLWAWARMRVGIFGGSAPNCTQVPHFSHT